MPQSKTASLFAQVFVERLLAWKLVKGYLLQTHTAAGSNWKDRKGDDAVGKGLRGNELSVMEALENNRALLRALVLFDSVRPTRRRVIELRSNMRGIPKPSIFTLVKDVLRFLWLPSH